MVSCGGYNTPEKILDLTACTTPKGTSYSYKEILTLLYGDFEYEFYTYKKLKSNECMRIVDPIETFSLRSDYKYIKCTMKDSELEPLMFTFDPYKKEIIACFYAEELIGEVYLDVWNVIQDLFGTTNNYKYY